MSKTLSEHNRKESYISRRKFWMEAGGRQCLLARRLVERGVRFIQLISGAYVSIEDTWDAHANIVSNHTKHAREVN